VTTASAALSAWLETRRRIVESALERYLPKPHPSPHRVFEAMRYSVFAGGKRLRPMLVLAAAEAVAEHAGAPAKEAEALALPAACAVEMIHTYSLVHDDLPAMDNDTMRRGRPTAHVIFGEAMAILSGDALLTEAFALLGREPSQAFARVGPEEIALRRLETIRILAEAAGVDGMVGGQAIDLDAAAPNAAPLDANGLRAMHARKTGALIRGSALAGAVMAGGAREVLDGIAAYATHLGLAFQIVDDILDVEGATEDLGKTAGKDAAAGKPTYPALYGLAESRRLAAQSIDAALAALSDVGLHGQLPAIAHWVVGRTH
jgi:geranylgeranyl diphosphate synthase type II